MKCERCSTALKWVGSLATGGLVCPTCACCEEPALDPHTEELLDNGVIIETGNGYEACCCRCGNWTELYADPSEIDLGYEHYCGGSPRCCP